MAIGIPREEMLASWEDSTFTTAPPKDEMRIPSAEELQALYDAKPEDLVEDADFGSHEGSDEATVSGSRFGYVDESHKLYVGKEFTLEQFEDWWGVQRLGSLPWTAGGIHHTYIPDHTTWNGLTSLNGVFNYYSGTLRWPRGKGPQLWLYAGDGRYKPGQKLVYVGTHPAHDGIGISYRNHRYLHIEAIGYYDSRAMPSAMVDLYRRVIRRTSGSRVPIKNAGAGVDGPRSPIGWIFHRNAPAAGKTCPGNQVRETSFFAAMNQSSPAPKPTPTPAKPTPKPPYTPETPMKTLYVVSAGNPGKQTGVYSVLGKSDVGALSQVAKDLEKHGTVTIKKETQSGTPGTPGKA